MYLYPVLDVRLFVLLAGLVCGGVVLLLVVGICGKLATLLLAKLRGERLPPLRLWRIVFDGLLVVAVIVWACVIFIRAR